MRNGSKNVILQARDLLLLRHLSDLRLLSRDQIAALSGFALSALIWLVVAVATPAPTVMVDVARIGARRVHDRLPQEIRERLPEELRVRITGS